MMPLVSIGVPTYNRPELLDRTLTELREQTYKNIEIIVSDNCSPDNKVREVIWKHRDADSRIRAYFQDTNIGINANHRFVRDRARGEYFAFSSDDDHHELEFIEKLIEPMLADPSMQVVVCGTVRVDTDGRYFDSTSLHELNKSGWPIWYVLDAMRNERLSFMQVMVWKTGTSRKLDPTPDEYHGKDVVINAGMLMSQKAVYVDQYLFTKGLEHDLIREQVSRNPLVFVRMWYMLVKTLAVSPHIPTARKLWIPLIAGTNGVWVIRNYLAQILFLLPVDHPVRVGIRKVLRRGE